MNNKLYFGINGTPLNKNNYSQAGMPKKVIHRNTNIPDIDDTPSLENVVNTNVVHTKILGNQCTVTCIPLLILVVVISLSILCSLFCDIFKNKKLTLYTLFCVIGNISAVCIYTWLCNSCQLNGSVTQIITKSVLPWVIYVLLISLVFLYISNRVIKK